MTPKLDGQYALLSEAYDFPTPVRAERRYVIASTPRSGSSFLAMRLWETGLLGAPLEYFNYQSWMLRMSGRLGASDIGDYLSRLLAVRTSANGVFGLKAHIDHMRFLTLANFWPAVGVSKIIRIDRTDRVAQAVSLVIASQSGRFSSLDPEGRRPEYNARAIRAAHAYLERSEHYWTQFAGASRIPIMTVDYERLCSAEDEVVQEALAFIAPGETPRPIEGLPRYERQSSDVNAQWIAKFKAEPDLG